MKIAHFLWGGLSAIALVSAIVFHVLVQPPPLSAATHPVILLPTQNPDHSPSLLTQLPPINQEFVVDKVADIVIDQFQNTSCEQLAQITNPSENLATPGSQLQEVIKKKAVNFLKNNPEIRKQFIDKVAPVIANKLFDCNVIP